MKHPSKRWLGVGLVALAVTALAEAPLTSVQVKTGQIRATPSFLGKLVGTANYGDRLPVIEQQGDWAKVTISGGQTGWIHSSALTKKKIVMKAGDQNAQVAAAGEELTLAGKGFNSDVEASFKAKNTAIDFTWVDRMERFKVAPEAMQRLLAEGGIQPSQGGAR